MVALGGGAFVNPESFDLIENHGISIWLDCPLAVIEKRIAEGIDARPLARDRDAMGRLYQERLPGYGRAHYRIHAECDVERAIEQILDLPILEMRRQLRQDAKTILTAALAAADPTWAVEQALRGRDDLESYRRIFVLGAGKAGGTMARTVENHLGDRIKAGCVNVKDGDPAKGRRIELGCADIRCRMNAGSPERNTSRGFARMLAKAIW